MKIRLVGAERGVTQLVVAVRSFANALKTFFKYWLLQTTSNVLAKLL